MTKTAQDFKLYEGDSKKLRVTVVDTDGDAVDVSGTELTWVMSRSGTAVITKLSDSTAGIEITNGPGGIVTINIDAADSADLSGFYDHELVLTDVNSNISTLLRGTVEVIADLT